MQKNETPPLCVRNEILIISPWQHLGYGLFFSFLVVFFEKIFDSFKEKIGKSPVLFNGKELELLYNGRGNSECDVFLFHTALIKYIKIYCNKKTLTVLN
jgi:hypothetical protein